jgi:catechol 2,3-dioxygenase-like lactoylglutathione lyase family enzyme
VPISIAPSASGQALDFTRLGGRSAGDWQARVTRAGRRLKVAHLYGYGHHMEFIEYLSGLAASPRYEPNMSGAAHVCLEVADIQATAAQLLAAGASLQGEMAEVSTGAAAGGWAGYIRDPNGIIIELYEPAPAKSP